MTSRKTAPSGVRRAGTARPRPPAPWTGVAPATRHNLADQFGKSLLRDTLSAAATPETEVEVVAATQKIDVYAVPDPSRAAERPKMGLLGDLSTEPALFEPFRNTPSLARVRRCLSKQLAWHHELQRRARAAPVEAKTGERPTAPTVPFPWLVIISPGRPATAIDVYGCKPTRPGVYEAVSGLHVRIVVLAELPRTRATLLLRMLGAGRLLKEALADLSALPVDAWESSVLAPLVIHFRLASRSKPGKKEDDVSAEMRAWFEDYQRKLRDEGRREGRDEGRTEEAARALLTALRVRGIAVPDAARERILAMAEPERLERWHERAIVATSLAEVLDEPS